MKLRQNIRHFAAKKALTMPVIGKIATEKLVNLHVNIFAQKADADHREERKLHLESFFECTFSTYVTALHEGFTEAEAREITHIQANFDFFNHGWTEMMEFPKNEIEQHYTRYEMFFDRYEIDIADPLGNFRTQDIPQAPSTPQRLKGTTHPHASGGFADDVYVEDEDGSLVVGGQPTPSDVDISVAPGLEDVESDTEDGKI
jgi:hypothetical protein